MCIFSLTSDYISSFLTDPMASFSWRAIKLFVKFSQLPEGITEISLSYSQLRLQGSMKWNPWTSCYKISDGCTHCYIYGPFLKRYRQNIVHKTNEFDPGPGIPAFCYAQKVFFECCHTLLCEQSSQVLIWCWRPEIPDPLEIINFYYIYMGNKNLLISVTSPLGLEPPVPSIIWSAIKSENCTW